MTFQSKFGTSLPPHHLPQVESVELVSRFWRRARPAVFEGLPFSAVLWLPEGDP